MLAHLRDTQAARRSHWQEVSESRQKSEGV